MYNDWEIINVNQLFEEHRWSVIHKLPSINGQNVVNEVVKPLAVSLNNNNQIITNFPSNTINSASNLSSTFINNQSNDQDNDNLQLHNKEELYPVQPNNSTNAVTNDLNDYTFYLKTDRDVHWVMEVICYGLSLPISTTEHYETVRDCVQIYCEWIHALIPNKSKAKLIPYPIRDDPNHYFKRILQHLYNIFVPRIGSVYTLHNISNSTELSMTDIISKQALLCHRVLRTISTLTEDENNLMDGDSWDNLLLFLLAVNDVLLAQPGEREDIGTHLCERVITVLFEIWIMACKRCFPTPSYWKTLQHLFSTWRHRPQVIDQWSMVCLIFTQRLVQLNNQMVFSNLQQQQEQCLYESLDNVELSQVLPNSTNYSSYIQRLIQEMDYVTVSQAWYRFLMVIKNPVDLSSPEIISRTKKFSSFATVVDPRQHPCLDILPQNFLKAMKGLAQLVDTFLSINNLLQPCTDQVDAQLNRNVSNVDGSNLSITSMSIPSTINDKTITANTTTTNIVTPPNSRKLIKKHTILSGLHSVNRQSSNLNSSSTNQPQQPLQSQTSFVPLCIQTYMFKPIKYSVYRPKINSILKMFGNWLFNAALITSENNLNNEGYLESEKLENFGSISSFNSLNNQTFTNSNETSNWNRRNSNDRVSIEMSLALQPENFEAGVAEAIGALCRLFSSKQTDEDVAIIYYVRFFEALKLGLSRKEPLRGHILSSILINGTQLFRLNLSGIDILIPDFLKAIELFIFEKEQTKFPPDIITELRRACIKIMLSLLAYPLHFNELPIKDCLTDEQSCKVFRSLKPELISLMLNAFHSEKDSLNLQMILGGFVTLLEDTSAYEIEQTLKMSESSKKKRSNGNENDQIIKDKIPDDAKSLYTVVLSSVCHLLMNQKKNDNQVSLAALEVLSEIARIHLNNRNVEESKKAINCICDYIVTQCSRGPTYHSKDMHSTLVAAYQCLAIWFSEHSYLLKDNECLNTLLEVIELGISGSKSTNFELSQMNMSTTSSLKSGSTGNFNGTNNKNLTKTTVFKIFKNLKPKSRRVQDCAEFLLDCLMNQFGCTPLAPCPPETVNGCCDLNELSLLQLINENIENSTGKKEPVCQTVEDACKRFKYFISESTILIGFINNPQNQSCYCLIRSPFGKFCWEMHFQLTADSNSNESHSDHKDIPRPISCLSHQPRNLPMAKNFPSSVDRVPLTKIENSIPSLKQVASKYPTAQQNNLNQMFKIFEQQKINEQNLKHRCKSDLKKRHFDCKKPKPPKISDLDCARLIVNHLGLMNLEKHNFGSLNAAQLVNLDLNNLELFNSIISLDSLTLRTCDTSFVFYVRKGRIHPQEILNSVCSSDYVKPAFLEFLSSLGTPINCKQHYGWTGNLFTSWKGNFNEGDSFSYDTHYYAEHGGAIFDGQKMSIYWADVSHELAFIVPSRGLEDDQQQNTNKITNNNQSQATTCSQSGVNVNCSLGSSVLSSSCYFEDKNVNNQKANFINSEQRSMSSYSDNDTISSTSHNLSENSSQMRNTSINNSINLNSNDLNQRKKNRQTLDANIGCDIKILIIWLENSEDEYSLPLSNLMQTTNTGSQRCKVKDHVSILIHPLKNGLFSIKLISSLEKTPFALPLLDGIVVSKRILGLFVRLTTLNIYKRRRLDMDSFVLPHVKRRSKISEIGKKFKLQGKEVEFYNSLF